LGAEQMQIGLCVRAQDDWRDAGSMVWCGVVWCGVCIINGAVLGDDQGWMASGAARDGRESTQGVCVCVCGRQVVVGR
jgi:hypothetical protein